MVGIWSRELIGSLVGGKKISFGVMVEVESLDGGGSNLESNSMAD